jgi:hypothetical protein
MLRIVDRQTVVSMAGDCDEILQLVLVSLVSWYGRHRCGGLLRNISGRLDGMAECMVSTRAGARFVVCPHTIAPTMDARQYAKPQNRHNTPHAVTVEQVAYDAAP